SKPMTVILALATVLIGAPTLEKAPPGSKPPASNKRGGDSRSVALSTEQAEQLKQLLSSVTKAPTTSFTAEQADQLKQLVQWSKRPPEPLLTAEQADQL